MTNKIIITAIFTLFTFSIFAQQDHNQLLLINSVKVAPSNVDAYENSFLKFVNILEEAKVDDVAWYSNVFDNYTYINAVPIDNLAEFNKSTIEQITNNLRRRTSPLALSVKSPKRMYEISLLIRFYNMVDRNFTSLCLHYKIIQNFTEQ